MWKKNKTNGYGRIIHPDGGWYEGYFLDDKADGLGKYTDTTGSVYIGEWIAD